MTFVVVFTAVLTLASILFGSFGMGAPEMLLALLIALAAAYIANRVQPAGNSETPRP